MKNKISTRQLVFLSLCTGMGLAGKQLFSPAVNVLTDLIRLPGGGASAAFSLVFVAIGAAATPWPFAATLACAAQGLLALGMGMSGYQGAFILLTYTVPGIVIDLVRRFFPERNSTFFCLACCLSNTIGAAVSNALVFRLRSTALILWLLVAASFGAVVGILGGMVYDRLVRIGAVKEV